MKINRQKALFLSLFLILAIALVACERPLQTGDDTPDVSDTTVDTTVDESSDTEAGEDSTGQVETDAPTTSGEEPATTGEETTAEEPEPVETEPSEEPAADTPRPAETQAEETTEDTVATEETAETTAEPTEAEAAESEEAEPATTEEATPELIAEETTTIPETHTVAQGENLYRIGLLYGISWVAIAQENNIFNANYVQAGQVLKLPQAEEATEPQDDDSGPTEETSYTVQQGDTLFLIGQQLGVSWVEIAEANGLVNPNRIDPGQVLKIPASAPGPSPEFSHVVQPGETLFRISLRYGVSWLAIAERNEIESPYVIFAGQTILIPGG